MKFNKFINFHFCIKQRKQNKEVIKIRVFISYKWEDKEFADGIMGTFLNPNNEYRHVPYSEKKDYRQQGENAIESYLRGLINECRALICLVGQNTHSSQWIGYELEVATSQNKKIVPVRIPNTTGGPPKLIRDRSLKVIRWDAQLINNELSR